MSVNIRTPGLPKRKIKGAKNLEDVTQWGSQVDDSLRDIALSLGDARRAVEIISSSTATTTIAAHAPQHLPFGADALATAIPVSIGVANAIGGANAFSNASHVHQGIHSIDAGISDLYGDVTFAAAGTGLTVAQVGQTITYTLAVGSGSGLDADTLDGIDSLGFIKANGTVPLTSAWDAGNFAITLGSIVGKSGTLSLTAATGGPITFTSSAPSGTTAFVFTSTVANTSNGFFSVVDAAGGNRFSISDSVAGQACFVFATAASGLVGHTAVWSVSGTAVRTTVGAFNGMNATLVNNGTGCITGFLVSTTIGGATSGFMQTGGFDIYPKYASTSGFGNNATRNRIYGGTIVLTFGNSATTGNRINSWGLLIGNTGTPDGSGDPVVQASINRWAGLLIGTRPTNLEDANTFGIFSKEDIGIASGRSFVFDDSCTFTTSTTPQSATNNDFSAHTKGTTYALKTGNTIAFFVNAAQAFHMDQNGATGNSRCYGNFLISGTTTSTGLLTGSAGIVATTGGVTATAGGVTATAGDITAVAGDLISGSDIAMPAGGILYFDGIGGNDTMQLGGGLIRTTVAGTTIFDIYSGGVDVAATKTYSIGSTLLILSQTGLTHTPAAAGVFTVTLKESMLITSTVAAPSTPMVDIFRNSTSGTPLILHVRDSGPTDYLKVTTTTGVQIGGASTVKIGFWGATPVVRPSAYTPTNVTTDRAYDANATTLDEVADVLGTLIADIQATGLIG